MYEVKIRLNLDEVQSYEEDGIDFIDSLAYDIGKQSKNIKIVL